MSIVNFGLVSYEPHHVASFEEDPVDLKLYMRLKYSNDKPLCGVFTTPEEMRATHLKYVEMANKGEQEEEKKRKEAQRILQENYDKKHGSKSLLSELASLIDKLEKSEN